MIKSIRHKALRSFWSTGSSKGLNPKWMPRLRIFMNALDAADTPYEMDFPGSYFHPLKGEMKGYYSIRITGNYRLIFQHQEDGFTLIDIVDYH